MNGTPSNQPGKTTKVPESGVETEGTAGSIRVERDEVITNNTAEGRERIALLLADTIDNKTN